jgi:cytosine deaminase
VSHAFALGSVPTDLAERTADLLAEAGVAIMSTDRAAPRCRR